MASVNQTNTETVLNLTKLKAMLGKVLRDRVECIVYGLFQAHRSSTILN